MRSSAFKLLTPQGQRLAAHTAVLMRVFTWQVLTGWSTLHALPYQRVFHVCGRTRVHARAHTRTCALPTREPRSGGLSDEAARAQRGPEPLRPGSARSALLCRKTWR